MNLHKIILLSAALISVFVLTSCAKNSSGKFLITDYGAAGDAKTLNTKAINKAFAVCAKSGGGTVVVPPGTFRTGALRMRGNTTLYLEAGAVLKASDDLNDYIVDGKRFGLISATNADNIAITGRGIIDGSGTSFMDMNSTRTGPERFGDFDPNFTRQGLDYMDPKSAVADGPVVPRERPGRLIAFSLCKNVLIRDVTITDAPLWTIHLDRCDGAVVSGVTIDNPLVIPNNDGIDLTSCSNVRISDCKIFAGDDSIAISSVGDPRHYQILGGDPLGPGKTENIAVTNCVLQSRSAAIRVGYTGGDLKNCTFSNIVIWQSNRGILVNVRDEASVENLLFSNITIQTRLHTGHWWGHAEPIQVSALANDRSVKKLGQIKNIRFSNILAESESGIVVWGSQNSIIEDLVFENVKVKIKNSPLNASYGGNFDLRTSADFATALFKHDIPALFCINADGLKIVGFQTEWEDSLPDFFNHSIWCQNSSDVVIDGFTGRQAHLNDNLAAILLENIDGAIVRNSTAAPGTDTFLQTTGLTGSRQFVNNETSNARQESK